MRALAITVWVGFGSLSLPAAGPYNPASDGKKSEPSRKQFKGVTDSVTIKDRLGARVDLNLAFTDHNGKRVKLGKYFDGKRPVILTLNYYRCKTLCSVQLNEVVKGLRKLEWSPGSRFRMVTVSIDPREKSPLAFEKRRNYLKFYGRGEVDWSFHTGDQANITALSDAVGFKYRYDKKRDQYIHVPAIFFLSPRGKLTRFLHGLRYLPRDLKYALMEASDGRIGTVTDKVFMSCFHFDPKTGKYQVYAFGIMRLAGIVVAVILVVTLVILFLLDRFVWRRSASS